MVLISDQYGCDIWLKFIYSNWFNFLRRGKKRHIIHVCIAHTIRDITEKGGCYESDEPPHAHPLSRGKDKRRSERDRRERRHKDSRERSGVTLKRLKKNTINMHMPHMLPLI